MGWWKREKGARGKWDEEARGRERSNGREEATCIWYCFALVCFSRRRVLYIFLGVIDL